MKIDVIRIRQGEASYSLVINSHLPTLRQKSLLVLSLGHLEHRHTMHTVRYAYVAATVSIKSIFRHGCQPSKTTPGPCERKHCLEVSAVGLDRYEECGLYVKCAKNMVIIIKIFLWVMQSSMFSVLISIISSRQLQSAYVPCVLRSPMSLTLPHNRNTALVKAETCIKTKVTSKY